MPTRRDLNLSIVPAARIILSAVMRDSFIYAVCQLGLLLTTVVGTKHNVTDSVVLDCRDCFSDGGEKQKFPCVRGFGTC